MMVEMKRTLKQAGEWIEEGGAGVDAEAHVAVAVAVGVGVGAEGTIDRGEAMIGT